MGSMTLIGRRNNMVHSVQGRDSTATGLTTLTLPITQTPCFMTDTHILIDAVTSLPRTLPA